jgi:hypothetical protein
VFVDFWFAYFLCVCFIILILVYVLQYPFVHHPDFNRNWNDPDIVPIYWDQSGNLLVSVCFPTMCVWSVTHGNVLTLLNRLDAGGNMLPNFYSCTFHPRYHVLVIEGQSISISLILNVISLILNVLLTPHHPFY